MIHLPERKKLQLQQIIAELMSKKSATKQELQSLVKKKYNTLQRLLNQAGASFGQLMNWRGAIQEKACDEIRLTREFKADLAWWPIFINQWNGSFLIWDHLHHYPEVTDFSDDSRSWGCGVLTPQSWIQHQWLLETGNLSIAHKELIPIVIACFVWGRQW